MENREASNAPKCDDFTTIGDAAKGVIESIARRRAEQKTAEPAEPVDA